MDPLIIHFTYPKISNLPHTKDSPLTFRKIRIFQKEVDCLGIVSFNSRNYIDADLLHEYFEKMDLLKEDAPKTNYSSLIKQWISDAEIIENEVQLLLHQITKKYLNP